MTDRQYVYKITEVVKITDGDTYHLRCDVGFRQNILINVRLYGYDCPEAHKGSDYEKQKAVEARKLAGAFLTGLTGADQLWIRTEKDPDNFGRWLGEIWHAYEPEGFVIHLGETLHKEELATIWPTRWRDQYDLGHHPTMHRTTWFAIDEEGEEAAT